MRYLHLMSLAGTEFLCEADGSTVLDGTEVPVSISKIIRIDHYPIQQGNMMGVATSYATINGFAETKIRFDFDHWILWRFLDPNVKSESIMINEHVKLYTARKLKKSGLVAPTSTQTNKLG